MSEKRTYLVIQAIGWGGDHYPRGSHVELPVSEAINIGFDYVEEVGGKPATSETTEVTPEKEAEAPKDVETTTEEAPEKSDAPTEEETTEVTPEKEAKGKSSKKK